MSIIRISIIKNLKSSFLEETWGKTLNSKWVNRGITPAAMGHDSLKLCKTHTAVNISRRKEVYARSKGFRQDFGQFIAALFLAHTKKSRLTIIYRGVKPVQTIPSAVGPRHVVSLLPEENCLTSSFKLNSSPRKVQHMYIVWHLHWKCPLPSCTTTHLLPFFVRTIAALYFWWWLKGDRGKAPLSLSAQHS